MANIYQKLEEKFIFASDSKSHPQIGIITVKNARSKFSCLGTFYHRKLLLIQYLSLVLKHQAK
jgi:hypothetical protein